MFRWRRKAVERKGWERRREAAASGLCVPIIKERRDFHSRTFVGGHKLRLGSVLCTKDHGERERAESLGRALFALAGASEAAKAQAV